MSSKHPPLDPVKEFVPLGPISETDLFQHTFFTCGLHHSVAS